jgi:DNA-binding XRE family transcriptional regulator
MNFQVISENGQKFVKVPLPIYERLEEDAELLHDLSALDAAKTEWLADGKRTIPHAVVSEIINGSVPLLVWREYRGMTQQALADHCGISRSLLSQMETGKKTGSVETLRKVAEVLRCRIDDLI